MAETSARGLRLAVGSPPRIMGQSGAPVDVPSAPLTRQQLLQLLGPIIPEHARRSLPQETSVEFDHASPSGAFKVTIMRNGPEIAVSIVPDPSAPAVSPPPAVPPAAAAAPPPRVVADNPGAPAIDRLFHLMVAAKASDLHLSSGMPALVRKDGRLQPLEAEAGPMTPDQMVALLEPITPEMNRAEFAERNDTDFAYEVEGLARFRANVFLDRKGRGAVFRVIPTTIISAEDLGLSSHILKLCKLSKGLVLVTGPTGSGKSTTLSAMIDHINKTRHDHIITIEDPIEFVHENKSCLINQREVRTHTGGFKSALRAAMREDPDIILVGELRDLETVAIAIETAETGHLVFGTLHTTTAASTVDRVIDQFPAEPQEAYLKAVDKAAFEGLLKRANIDTKFVANVAAG